MALDPASAHEEARRCRQLWAALVFGLIADAEATGRGSAVELARRHARTWLTVSADRDAVLGYAGIDVGCFHTRILPRLKRAWAESDQLRLTYGRGPGRPRHEGQAAA